MLSLVGSIQPDPFSPEHVPQAKSSRVRSPQPYSHAHTVPDPIEPGDSDDEGLDVHAWPGQSDNDAVRSVEGGRNKVEKKERKQEEKKRKRNAVSKADSKPKAKRKKAE